ncbi:MAG TPA: glycosyl hydrolase, partial [Bacteroidales bacterium]|nr:glycosyl hydrolase [Bacteroidales bacterium]
ASFNNTFNDDFKPYLLVSTDKGKSWTPITDGLPENGSVHTIEQDFVNKDLLFCGTEFGAFFSNNGGKKWIQLKSGIPTTAVYDMAIQQRETDLVLATFGRGMYVMDNYSPLRNFNENTLNETAKMYPIKDALVYIEADGRYGQGSTYFLAKNRDFGATFTYFVKEVPKTDKENRQKTEKDLFDKGEKMPVYDWKTIQDQDKQLNPYFIFRITDEKGNVIR